MSKSSTPKPAPTGKAQRIAVARAEAARIKAEQERKARRTTGIVVGTLVLALVLVVTVVVVIIVQGGKSGASDLATQPVGATDNGGITVGVGGVAGGETASPKDAVRVDIYSDYLCPGCGQLESILGQTLADKADAKEIILVAHPLANLDSQSAGTQYSTRSTNAAATVAMLDPEHFWAFHQALFANQPTEQQEDTMLSDEQLAQLAQDVGVPAEVTDRFALLELSEWVTFARDESAKVITSTPTVMMSFNGSEPQRWTQVSAATFDQALANTKAGLPPDGE